MSNRMARRSLTPILLLDQIIRAALTAAFPDDAILTEEGADDESRLAKRLGEWIVDPMTAHNSSSSAPANSMC